MPAFEPLAGEPSSSSEETLQFPPVSRDHILHCSYDYWFPKYRKVCIRSRIIALPPDFVDYLREDGIILSDEGSSATGNNDDDDDDWEPSNPMPIHRPAPQPGEEEEYSDSDDDEEEEEEKPPPVPPNRRFPEIHQRIRDDIRALGGAAAPKLNWSAPKDATWLMEQKNTMRCEAPDDVYFLLKSSSFVSHDLEYTFDGCTPAPAPAAPSSGSSTTTFTDSAVSPTPSTATAANPAPTNLGFNPVLVLRSYFEMHTALEFRCFVKHRNLVAITPRDLKYYPFLRSLRAEIVSRVKALFHARLQFTFPDGCFAFDVYIPEKEATYDDSDDSGDEDGEEGRRDRSRLSWARLIDINPWAPRTDTLLFTWQELLDLNIPRPFLGVVSGENANGGKEDEEEENSEDSDESEEDEEEDFEPELRLVEKDDPAAMNFSSSPYSAHKLPKEVVDASMAGTGGLAEFARQWQRMLSGGGSRQ